MRQRIATAALVLAWLCANGAVWDALQLAAWGKMFASYSALMPVNQALTETFDPAKPCEMCVGIAKARGESRQKQSAIEQQVSPKFLLVMEATPSPIFANEPGEWPRVSGRRLIVRTDPVPLPPPRA